MSLINKSKFIGATYMLLINKSKFTGSTKGIIYPAHIHKSLINESTTGTSCILPFNYTGTSCGMVSLFNKLTNDIISLVYKLLMFVSKAIAISLTISLLGFSSILSLLGRGKVTTRTNIKSLLFIKSLIFFLLSCNQVEGTSISLTKLNLLPISISISSSNTSSTTMSNPPSPINTQVLNNPVAIPPPPPPIGVLGTCILVNGVFTQTRARSFTTAASYTVNERVIATRATKKIKNDNGVWFSKNIP